MPERRIKESMFYKVDFLCASTIKFFILKRKLNALKFLINHSYFFAYWVSSEIKKKFKR